MSAPGRARTSMRAAAKPRLEEHVRAHGREADSAKRRTSRCSSEVEARPLRWQGKRAKRSASGEVT